MNRKSVLTVLLALMLALCTAAAFAEPVLGGWEISPAEAGVLPEEAQAAFTKAVGKIIGAEYTPVALMGTQVVAGINYCILCQITPVVPNPVPVWALVYIYADLKGNAEITNVYEVYIDYHAEPKQD